MREIAIVDYGMGNLRSVQNALAEVGGVGEIVSTSDQLASYSKIILPGVGAFGDAAERLHASGLMEAIRGAVSRGHLLLGICLGMQLLCANSDESPGATGLGFFDVSVKRLAASDGQRVPHIGWNPLVIEQPHWIVAGIASSSDVYFLHSYAVDIQFGRELVANAIHTNQFPAIIARDGILGIQFHPEKSQKPGLKILRNFVDASTW